MSTSVVPRRPGEPAPDLTDYRVVHRAMVVDLHRLAAVAAELVHRPDARRSSLLRDYLITVSEEIHDHHEVEDELVWPLLVAAAGPRAALRELTDDHDLLEPLLLEAGELAERQAHHPTPAAARGLARTLRELADLVTRHVVEEERDVFPLIAGHLRDQDYARVRAAFRAGPSPYLQAFRVPWVLGHATAAERARLLAAGGAAVRVVALLFGRRFRARQEVLFG